MGALDRHSFTPSESGLILPGGMTKRTERALAAIEEQTLLNIAEVRAISIQQGERLRELDRMTETAAIGHAMLRKLVDTVGTADAFVADEVRSFVDINRVAKQEILIDTAQKFRRERLR